MTEAELAAIEARYGEIGGPRAVMPALIAEVRRLRGLMKQAEWRGADEPGVCPWCEGSERRHFLTCPAFPPEG